MQLLAHNFLAVFSSSIALLSGEILVPLKVPSDVGFKPEETDKTAGLRHLHIAFSFSHSRCVFSKMISRGTMSWKKKRMKLVSFSRLCSGLRVSLRLIN